MPYERICDVRSNHAAIEGLLAKHLFFIVGSPKSGTTWLQKALNGHPDIWCSGESHFCNRLLPSLRQLFGQYNLWATAKHTAMWPGELAPELSAEDIDYLAIASISLLLNRWKGADDAAYIGEKTPDHIQCMAEMSRLIPNAKFIHIVRDGRDALISAWHHFPNLNPRFRQEYPTIEEYIPTFAQLWATFVQNGRHFMMGSPQRCLEVRYEDMHRDFSASVKRILDFLGAESTAACIEACRQAGSFERLSGGRSQGTEDRSSHFRKGSAGDWRHALSSDAQRAFTQHAGHTLKALGYKLGYK